MRFTSFILAGAMSLVASAQSTETTASSVSAATATTTDAAQASTLACLDACDEGDVDCQAQCIAVPSPNTSQVNATTDCVANCDQGNGTAAANEAYGDCVQACIDDNYFTSGTAGATANAESTATGSAATAATTGTGTGTATGTATRTGTATSSSGSAAATDSAADAVRVGMTGAGLFGILAAFVAL